MSKKDPFILPTFELKNKIGTINKDIPINQYISNDIILEATETGLIIPVIPTTAIILKIFEPIKLPTEIPDSFL